MNRTDEIHARLRAILSRVSPADADMLLAFGEFLVARASVNAPVAASPQAADTAAASAAEAGREPLPIARPDAETVMQALKRLSATYPMLDRKKLLDATSTLVMQHLVAGRDRVEVIDELEIVFRREFDSL